MNQDRDDILALRAENDPPIKVEVRRAQPTPKGRLVCFDTSEEYDRYVTVAQIQQIGALAAAARRQRATSPLAGTGQPLGPFGQAFGGGY